MGFINNFSGKPGDMALPSNMPPPPIPKRLRASGVESLSAAQASLPSISTQPLPVKKFENELKSTNFSSPSASDYLPISFSNAEKGGNFLSDDFKISNSFVPDRLPDLSIPIQTTNFRFDSDIPSFEVQMFAEPKDEILPMHIAETLVELKQSGPLYIRTDDYGQIISNIDLVAGYIQESPGVIYVLNNIKKNMDIEHKNFAKSLEDLQRKFIYIDNMLFESMKEV